MTNATTTAPRAVEIFYSYAHEDRDLRLRLENQLKVLQRQGLISQWTDRLIKPGDHWDQEINESLDRAAVILLLLSEYFLASDYIDGVEMKRAFEREANADARVVPIILRECLWRDDKRLSALEPLPHNRRPVTGWRDRSAAFAEVAAGIKSVAQDLCPQAFFGVSTSFSLPTDAAKRIEELPPVWNIPNRRDVNFIDRDTEMAVLETHFATRPAVPVVIAGPPGIGKTSLATEFAYRHAHDYDAVWWVRSKPATLDSDLPALAWVLRLPEAGVAEPGELARAVSRWMTDSGRYLVIFDDAADLRAVLDRVPAAFGGHVLLTTDADTIPERAKALRLKPVSLGIATDFLRTRIPAIKPGFALDMARALGGLPLALGLASTYLGLGKETPRTFVEELEVSDGDDPNAGAAAALEHIISRILATNPDAANLLRLVAFLAPEDIPLADVIANAHVLGDPLAGTLGDAVVLDDLVESLAQYGVAWRAGDAMSLHRLVQTFVRGDMLPDDEKRWSAVAVALVESAFPDDSRNARTWRRCARLLPHALAAIDHAETLGAAPLEAGRLLRRIAVYQVGRAQLDDARTAAERALTIHETSLGDSNVEVAADLVALGRVHQARDDLRSARECFERAVAIDEVVLGPNDPKVASDLIYLGRFLRRIRDLDAAEQTLKRAIELAEHAKGGDDRDVAWALGHLGRVLQDAGKLPEARTVLVKALAADEKLLGPDHPDVATDLVNLGRVLRELKELDLAEEYLTRARVIVVREYGADHYEVAIVEANLGRVRQDRGDLDGAETHLGTAVEILHAGLGDEHSYTTTARDWLEDVRRARTAGMRRGSSEV